MRWQVRKAKISARGPHELTTGAFGSTGTTDAEKNLGRKEKYRRLVRGSTGRRQRLGRFWTENTNTID